MKSCQESEALLVMHIESRELIDFYKLDGPNFEFT